MMNLRACVAGVLGLLAAVPSVVADQFTFISSRDGTLYIDPSGGTANGAGPTMYVGRNQQGGIRRGVIAFDVSPIPPGSTITSATLTMVVSRTRTGSSATELHRITADWGTGLSNAGMPGGAGADALAGDATWIH